MDLTPEEEAEIARLVEEISADADAEEESDSDREHRELEELVEKSGGFYPNLGIIHRSLGLDPPDPPAAA